MSPPQHRCNVCKASCLFCHVLLIYSLFIFCVDIQYSPGINKYVDTSGLLQKYKFNNYWRNSKLQRVYITQMWQWIKSICWLNKNKTWQESAGLVSRFAQFKVLVRWKSASSRSASPAALWLGRRSRHALWLATAAGLHCCVGVLQRGAVGAAELDLPLTGGGLLAALTLVHHHVSCCRIPACTQTKNDF